MLHIIRLCTNFSLQQINLKSICIQAKFSKLVKPLLKQHYILRVHYLYQKRQLRLIKKPFRVQTVFSSVKYKLQICKILYN